MNKNFFWGVVIGVGGTWVWHQMRPMKSASA